MFSQSGVIFGWLILTQRWEPRLIKTRPVVVIGSDGIGKLPLKLVAPIIDWKDSFPLNPWHVNLELDRENGLTKASAVDTLQLRGVDIQRFIKRFGQLASEKMAEVVVAIAIVIEYSPQTAILAAIAPPVPSLWSDRG